MPPQCPNHLPGPSFTFLVSICKARFRVRVRASLRSWSSREDSGQPASDPPVIGCRRGRLISCLQVELSTSSCSHCVDAVVHLRERSLSEQQLVSFGVNAALDAL